jgi:hypothetical protein
MVQQSVTCRTAGRHHQLCASAAVRLRQYCAGRQQPGAPVAGVTQTVPYLMSFPTLLCQNTQCFAADRLRALAWVVNSTLTTCSAPAGGGGGGTQPHPGRDVHSCARQRRTAQRRAHSRFVRVGPGLSARGDRGVQPTVPVWAGWQLAMSKDCRHARWDRTALRVGHARRLQCRAIVVAECLHL